MFLIDGENCLSKTEFERDLMINIHTIEILMGAGVLAGYIDSIAGGSGLITLPTLLSLGIPPHLALGTNKLAGTFGTFNASRAFIRKKIFNPLLWEAAILATLIGAIIGVLLSHFISAEFLKHFIPLAIILIVIYVAFYAPKKSATNSNPAHFKPRTHSSALMGIILGFYDGFLGPGAGSFWASTLMAVYKLDLLTASAVARFMNFISNFVALITFMILRNVDYRLGICMGIGLFIGAQLGVHSAVRFGPKFIKPVFLIIVSAVAVHMII